MGKTMGFKEYGRELPRKRAVVDRIQDFKEFYGHWSEDEAKLQAARCMDCGVPFCHTGCPLGNIIPDWNDLVYRGKWQEALAVLHRTNNFPEFTGRICPAPCETSCVLSINQEPVAIEHIERAIVDHGFREGWIKPDPPELRTGKSVCVVGSGPAGLAAAAQLNKAGHKVVVFERDHYVGGLLTLGIPGFKLEKEIVFRRIELMKNEGIEFRTGIHVGLNYHTSRLQSEFDAVLLAGGSTQARDLSVPGRDLYGIHFAMEYLPQENRVNLGEIIDPSERITAFGKRVVILGGGDTGADCLGTAHRQGAIAVHQFELLPEPPKGRVKGNPWPEWPMIIRLSAAHEEGGSQRYSVATKAFSGNRGQVEKLHAVRMQWKEKVDNEPAGMVEVPDSEFAIETDLVLLAMGFLHPEHEGMLKQLGVKLDRRGNVSVDSYKMTSQPGIFAAGDMARGQSLVVWAIAEGRAAAYGIDKYLMGSTSLPRIST